MTYTECEDVNCPHHGETIRLRRQVEVLERDLAHTTMLLHQVTARRIELDQENADLRRKLATRPEQGTTL